MENGIPQWIDGQLFDYENFAKYSLKLCKCHEHKRECQFVLAPKVGRKNRYHAGEWYYNTDEISDAFGKPGYICKKIQYSSNQVLNIR